jgi:hypothetical protein
MSLIKLFLARNTSTLGGFTLAGNNSALKKGFSLIRRERSLKLLIFLKYVFPAR